MKPIKTLFLTFLLFSLSNTVSSQRSNKEIIKNVIEHYFEAIGGKDKAAQIETFSSISSSTLKDKKIVLTKKMMLPNRFYTAMEYDGFIVSKNIFNGKKGISIQQDVEKKFSKDELKRHKKNRSIFPEFDYVKTAKYAGIATVKNEDCHVLEVKNAKVFYSTKTGLKVKGISLQEKDGHTFLQELYFSNYIEIKGLFFPSQLKMIAGNSEIQFQTRSILINRDVTKNDFE